MPVLLLATLRPPTRERHEVIAQLDALGRRARTIELTGLAVDEVAGLIPAAWSAEQVHTATAGNPLFVAEIARLTNVDGHLDGSLIDVVRRRLDALDPLVADVISAASVLGPDASPPTIASIVGAVDVGPLIDVACAADLLAVEDDRTVVAHPLIAEAATSRLDQSHRHAYHAAAASLVSELDGRTSDVAALRWRPVRHTGRRGSKRRGPRRSQHPERWPTEKRRSCSSGRSGRCSPMPHTIGRSISTCCSSSATPPAVQTA